MEGHGHPTTKKSKGGKHGAGVASEAGVLKVSSGNGSFPDYDSAQEVVLPELIAPVNIPGEDGFEEMPIDGEGWDDEDGEWSEEAAERVALASLQREMCRPLSHLWALPRQRVAGHANGCCLTACSKRTDEPVRTVRILTRSLL